MLKLWTGSALALLFSISAIRLQAQTPGPASPPATDSLADNAPRTLESVQVALVRGGFAC
jgi:hypothetical protein